MSDVEWYTSEYDYEPSSWDRVAGRYGIVKEPGTRRYNKNVRARTRLDAVSYKLLLITLLHESASFSHPNKL